MENEKIIDKIVFEKNKKLAIIFFIIAAAGILTNLLVMLMVSDDFIDMFENILHGYIAGFILFFVFLVLGIIALIGANGELVLTDRRVYIYVTKYVLFSGRAEVTKSILLNKINSIDYFKLKNKRALSIVTSDDKINVCYRINDSFYENLIELTK